MIILGYIRRKTEAEDQKIDESWGSITWLANKTLLEVDGMIVGRVVIKPGMENPRHCHPNSDEILYLLKGKLEHSLGDEKVILEEGDTLRVQAGIVHNAVNIGDEDADMIVVYPTSDRQLVKKK